MRTKILLVFTGVLILASCGTSRRVTVGNEIDDRSDIVETEKIKTDKPGDHRQPKHGQARDVQENVADKEKQPVRQQKQRPEMTFTAAQCLHLQTKGINPLPASGILELDLNAMAGDFCYPAEGALISAYGKRGASTHTGIDIKMSPRDTIRAAFPGVVRMAKLYSSYGNLVAIRHYEGFETVYAHASKLLVDVNNVVEAGDPIALAGRTGRATTEHLHFEVRAGNGHINPERMFDTKNRSLHSGKLYFKELNGYVTAYADDIELQMLEQSRNSAASAQQANVKPGVNIRTDAVASAPGETAYYRVRKGDTLSAIAVKHKTTVTKLCQLNNIKPTSLLQINQRLRVR